MVKPGTRETRGRARREGPFPHRPQRTDTRTTLRKPAASDTAASRNALFGEGLPVQHAVFSVSPSLETIREHKTCAFGGRPSRRAHPLTGND
jgi:hypothetical protein